MKTKAPLWKLLKFGIFFSYFFSRISEVFNVANPAKFHDLGQGLISVDFEQWFDTGKKTQIRLSMIIFLEAKNNCLQKNHPGPKYDILA